MDPNQFETLRQTMAETLAIEAGRITADSTQDQIPEWDSIAHLNLMLALEETFNVKLTVQNMQQLNSVPEIIRFLHNSCSSK